MKTSFDAVVVGAGPAGAAAALALARAGVAVAVVEKTAFPRRKVCGEFVSATTWPLLRELGLGALAALAGPPVREVGLFAAQWRVSAAMPRPAQPEAWGRAIAREVLDAVLLEKAIDTGAHAWQPWSVEACDLEGEGYRLTLASRAGRTAELRARFVIDAHGSWERTPGAASAASAEPSDLLGFKAQFVGGALPEGLMPLVLFPGGYGGMVHGADGRVSFSCCIRRDALRACRARHPRASAGEAVMAHVAASCRGVRDTLGTARREGAWLAAGPIRPGVRALARRGLFRAGNAAGEAHPLAAEGISMAIQSAWLLCGELTSRDRFTPAALDEAGAAYERDWRAHFVPRVRASMLFASLTMSRAGAPASVAAVRAMPALLALGARLSGKAHMPRPPRSGRP